MDSALRACGTVSCRKSIEVFVYLAVGFHSKGLTSERKAVAFMFKLDEGISPEVVVGECGVIAGDSVATSNKGNSESSMLSYVTEDGWLVRLDLTAAEYTCKPAVDMVVT